MEEDASDHSKPLISISTNQLAVGMAAAYALTLAITLVGVMGIFIFASLLAPFFGADLTIPGAMIGAIVICVILMLPVFILFWGAKSLLRRKPWQTVVFFIFLCSCLALLFRVGQPLPGSLVLMSALAFLSAIVLVVRWKRVFIQRQD